jgi:hypothetical protein
MRRTLAVDDVRQSEVRRIPAVRVRRREPAAWIELDRLKKGVDEMSTTKSCAGSFWNSAQPM